MSLALAASADGEKLPITVLIPRKTALPDYEPPANLHVVYGTNDTFKADTVRKEILDNVVLLFTRRKKLPKPLLIIDSAPVHKHSSISVSIVCFGILYVFNSRYGR